MTEGGGEPLPPQPTPYTWDDAGHPATEVLQLWTEVGNGLDKNQTVVWKSAVESLDHASKNLRTSQDARFFVEKYMESIIGILVEQQPAKIGMHERTCVQESLALGVSIVVKDLEIQLQRNGECALLTTLTHIFNKKKAFYKGNKGNWNVNHLAGLPEVRMRNIERFRVEGGFSLLQRYLIQKMSSPAFPKLDHLHQVLQAAGDMIPSRVATAEQIAAIKEIEDDAIAVAKAVMQYIESISDEGLKKLPPELLGMVQQDLQRIFDRLIGTRRTSTYEFYQFWRSLVLKLITSQSLPLKLYGWEQVGELIDACADHRPPPRSYTVTNAGCPFANGNYEYAGEMTPDGYARAGADVSYVHQVGDEIPNATGKKLTLFRCTMRSQQKWWFLSEADEEQPGTDRDIDYYQHKSKEHEEAFPPARGWITCRNAGVDPPPNLEAKGVLVPAGSEFDTLEHQLAKWAIENEIVEQVLGDTTIHREVVARSTALIKFLASMCNRDQPTENDTGDRKPNQYCLQPSHLLYAWKTSTRKADAAVAHQVYQLLVTILPLCPSDLAIPLLSAVQTSLVETQQEKHDNLFEVSEFCSALASANLVDAKNAAGTPLSEDVREKVLDLLWSVLVHPNASSLKSYDSLKRYVTHELKVEPKGSEHRERFLRSSIAVLSTNAGVRQGHVDEMQALRMVKLMHFVLEACPREQAGKFALNENGKLPRLLFDELVAYLERRKSNGGTSTFRKASHVPPIPPSVASSEDETKEHAEALNGRLRILRFVYGLSDPRAEPPMAITLSQPFVQTLWNLCDSPEDRECLMVFIASASHTGKASQYDQFSHTTAHTTPIESLLSPAFTEEDCHAIFLEFFCSPSFNYEKLGHSAYRSFQFLFSKLRQAAAPPAAKKKALDALWRLCLSVEKPTVASQGMKDLLAVYVQIQRGAQVAETDQPGAVELMVTDDSDESFGDRIFEYLTRVKDDLRRGAPDATRPTERCLQILNAAIGQSGNDASLTSSTLNRLDSLHSHASLEEAMKCLPHGMRGQACYRRIAIIARRTQMQNQANQSPGYDGRNSTPKPPSAMRFTLDVHPLETLASLKRKVALQCQCIVTSVKPLQINGRGGSRTSPGDPAHMSLNVVPEDSVMDELGVVHGCEFIFVIAEQRQVQNTSSLVPRSGGYSVDLSNVFFTNDRKFVDSLFDLLLQILENLRRQGTDEVMTGPQEARPVDTHKLVWDFLLAMPTNSTIADRVKAAQARASDEPSVASTDDAMEVDSSRDSWSTLLDTKSFDRSVYILLTIDAYLQPAQEALSVLAPEQRGGLEAWMVEDAESFRRAFIEAGGFGAVVRFFSESDGDEKTRQSRTRRGNAVALRILKSCLFGNTRESSESEAASVLTDQAGSQLLKSLSNTDGLMNSLTAMVVDDAGISSSTIMDILKFLRLLFRSQRAAKSFVSLPNAEKFLVILLMWDEGTSNPRSSSSISAAMHVRKNTHDLILQTPLLADRALPWLMYAIENADAGWENTSEYFDVLEKLVVDDRSTAKTRAASDAELRDLGTIVCKKLASSPRPSNEAESYDFSTGVLCGCLKLLRALIDRGGGSILRNGANVLLTQLGIEHSWSSTIGTASRGVLALVSSPFSSRPKADDGALIDIMGAIFDRFLSPGDSSTVAICCDQESRRRGFDVIAAATRACRGGEGYLVLVNRIGSLISNAAPKLRHRWGQFGAGGDSHSRHPVSSKYTGLRNQGCTCYMNSFLQQLFMMDDFKKNMCSATIPSTLRSSGSGVAGNGERLVGKKISLQWDTGASFDAMVESFDEATGMHTIRYCPVQVATVGGSGQNQVQPEEVACLPPVLPDEFVLTEGRPCRETGVFEVAPEPAGMETEGAGQNESSVVQTIKETEDESSSRHLLEEVQRTFIHLEEGSKGRCFDPRALVEACACLKLEFDVWQQNDASEFATKLLDRLEISLKKWAPEKFKYVDHTFGLQQTTQKICKECGLKTNREEKLLSIDCQIRGKSDIHEALATMTEAQIMEGSNKVNCDRCKKKTDTVIRTAISTLPNMLILSLKRFDLDYNTFETVKLNNRCAFGQTLDMKAFTLEGLEEMEQANKGGESGDPSPMDTEESRGNADNVTPKRKPNDDDYQYRLAGVLVHAGVAQGGHYYSFIRDRSKDSNGRWFKFDDEDVTPFDPAGIESECFGGKVKKETKWANGQVHTVEQEQFANALMLFYEKVKQTPMPDEDQDEAKKEQPPEQPQVPTSTGYDIFEPDVLRSNAIHRLQSFLFDGEFQAFLKGLLTICHMTARQAESLRDQDDVWRGNVVQVLLSYVFDVMLYSSDTSATNEWARLLEDILASDRQSSYAFVQRLAAKTYEISSNWLRTYLLECPDHMLRSFAVRIFSAAINSCSTIEEEQKALAGWAAAWRQQVNGRLGDQGAKASIMPCALEGKWAALEDVNKLGTGGTSCLGIIISCLNSLLETMPRCWRFSLELCVFIKNLSLMKGEDGLRFLRSAMVDALIPPRLIALSVRERCPAVIKAAFPGASISIEAAQSQLKAESNPAAHVMPLSGSQVMNASDMNSSRGPIPQDYTILLEALACLAGLPGSAHAPLVRENEEVLRGRQRFVLSDPAIKALTIIFQESRSPGAPGMGQREIESYLHRCGVESNAVGSQKIQHMLSKYPTTPGGNGSKGVAYLSLDGFLAYYRDTVQSNDIRLRLDLHVFGFRPDLTRRSRESRFHTINERETARTPIESVAHDVAETFGDKAVDLGPLTDLAMASCVHLYNLAYTVSEPLVGYLVAAAVHRKESEALINRTLHLIYQTPNDWTGNDSISACSVILQAIASTPGEDQQKRVTTIMLSNSKVSRTDHGVGLLHVLQALYRVRQSQAHYNNEVHWTFARYINILKDLQHIYPIFRWLGDNRNLWSFVERELDSRPAPPHQNQPRGGDFGTRDADNTLPLEHPTHSDSDMNGMHDSEDDDEDSQFENMVPNVQNNGPYQIHVQGAGNPAVNGHYNQDGFFESACRYVMDGRWNSNPYKFFIFQCNVSNNTKHWYISIVPYGGSPGTSSDIDFYTAPMTEDCQRIPPKTGWIKANEGKEPAPTLEYIDRRPEGWSSQVVEVDQEDNGNSVRSFI